MPIEKREQMRPRHAESHLLQYFAEVWKKGAVGAESLFDELGNLL